MIKISNDKIRQREVAMSLRQDFNRLYRRYRELYKTDMAILAHFYKNQKQEFINQDPEEWDEIQDYGNDAACKAIEKRQEAYTQKQTNAFREQEFPLKNA